MKTVTTTITCDTCGADLASHDTPATLYRIAVSAEQIAKASTFSYAMEYEPPIKPSHFCNLHCLAKWAA